MFRCELLNFWEGKLTAGNPPNMELWKINVDQHLRLQPFNDDRESKEKPTKKISNLSSDRFTLAILLLYGGGLYYPQKKRDYFISHETNPYTPSNFSMECH